MTTKEILIRLEKKLKRKANTGWDGWIGVIHIEDIIKLIKKELDGLKP